MTYHKSVLLNETIDSLNLKEGDTVVDCTLGGGGHSLEILKRIGEKGLLIGFDRDPEAIEEAENRLKDYPNKILINSNFANLKAELGVRNIRSINGILFDLGVSSHQLDADRGFSFQREEALDMRMSSEGPTAAYYVNTLPEEDLANIIYKYGEEKLSRKIAHSICEVRKTTPFETTKQLSDLISQKIGWAYKREKIHPATRTFQAIRIYVNDELSSIEKAVQDGIDLLETDGVISVISFHSLEDRIIKNIFKYNNGKCKCPPEFPMCICNPIKKINIINKKPILPTEEEIKENPRASSSKLRIGIKI